MNKKIPPTKQQALLSQVQSKPKPQTLVRQDSRTSTIHDESSMQSSRNIRSKDLKLEHVCIPLDQNLKEKHHKFSVLTHSAASSSLSFSKKPSTSTSTTTEIYFPYKPYDVQITYMEQVLNCLERRENGLLESPTGTGKTLSLLCSTLAWLTKRREASQHGPKDSIPNRIIYCSRTHSQIQQAVKELKRTVYQPRILVQGSREQYCIKKEFEQLKGGVLNAACQKALTPSNLQNHCKFFQNGMDDSTRDLFKLRMPDIEDLRIDGYNNKYCPYYQVQRTNNAVDVLFLPYNYLLDRGVRAQTEIITKNAVIIFDEAHNIHKTAEEGFSLSLQYSSLCAAEKDLVSLSKFIARGFASASGMSENDLNSSTPIKTLSEKDRKNFNSCEFDCQAMLKPIIELKAFFKSKANTRNNDIKEGNTIFEWIQIHTRSSGQDKIEQPELSLFKKALDKELKKQQPISSTTQQHSTTSPPATFENGINLNNISIYIQKANLAIKDLVNGTSHYGLEVWVKFLEGLRDLWVSHTTFGLKSKNPKNAFYQQQQQQFPQMQENTDVMKDFKVYFDNDDKDNPLLNVICLNPSINFSKILAQDPHCLIFTSGTLKPFDFWKSELRIPFPVVLENQHVIDPARSLFSTIVKHRPIVYEEINRFIRDPTFNFSYEKRSDQQMLVDLGNALIELLMVIPSGVLVVFPSNQLMDSCRSQWTLSLANGEARILSRLTDIKNVYWEQRSSTETSASINDYKQKSKTDRGAVFFCVARGKITEGIDFSDEYARAVILVGLPYPPLMNVKIAVKRQYLDELKTKNNERLSGDEWYKQEAIRAMNQSIGRVIRHIDDWGCILFLDERFQQHDIISNMPKWCPIAQTNSFDSTLVSTSEFFAKRKKEIERKNEQHRIVLAEKRRQEEKQLKLAQTSTSQSENPLEQKKRVFDFSSSKSFSTSNNNISSFLPAKQKKFMKSMVLVREETQNEIPSLVDKNEESSQEQQSRMSRSVDSLQKLEIKPISQKQILDSPTEKDRLEDSFEFIRNKSQQSKLLSSRIVQPNFSSHNNNPIQQTKQSKLNNFF